MVSTCGWCVNLEAAYTRYTWTEISSLSGVLQDEEAVADSLYATNGGGRAAMRLSGVRDLAFGGWSAKSGFQIDACSHPPTRCRSLVRKGFPTATTRDRTRNPQDSTGGYWPWASLYLV